ncbi:MAG: thiosulfate oxidation carrier complex protein SoxZ [Pseudomonadota bacterium]
MTLRARISVPKTVAAGSVVTIKTLITHKMETGFRRDAMGEAIPRDILKRFECRLDGALVFAADLQPGIAANPYLTFQTRIERGGQLEFVWTDLNGERHRETREISVAG